MEQRQHSADHVIPQAGEPTGLSRRQVVEVATQDLDEHQFGQPGQYLIGPGAAEAGLIGHLAGEAVKPGLRQAPQVHPARERLEQGVERTAVAAEEPADGRHRPGSSVAEDDGVGIAGGGGGVNVRAANVSPARQHVSVAVGKDNHVARDQLDWFLPDHTPVTAAFGDDVVRDQVLGTGHDPGRELPGGHCLDAPGVRRLDREKERAIEADHTQQV